ncbi:hypothetical protein V4D30_01180 [Thermodesulfovibrio sp. 3907-1M]|uniref:DNA-binding protein n=1 Tax=Thermodesulfovibrio autotrophicus TaxID=3118333 RepID=A0AAU8GWQ3_9BACT
MELLILMRSLNCLKLTEEPFTIGFRKSKYLYVKINRKLIRFRPQDIQDFIQNHFVKATDVDEVVDEILSTIKSEV